MKTSCLQAAGKGGTSIASDLIERLSDGKSLTQENEELARNVTGIAYAGEAMTGYECLN